MTFCYSFEFIQQHPTGQFSVHRSTKMGQIEKTGTKEITMQGCSYDPKGSFGSEKVGG